MIIKSSLGLSFGVVFSVLLFKRRAWPAWVGLGFGAGRAWEEADGMFTLHVFLRLADKVVITNSATGPIACWKLFNVPKASQPTL